MLLFTLQCYYRVRKMLQKRMMVRKKREHKGNSCEIQNTRSLKSVRLIMTPLIGIMLSNCDVSVRMSCLNTWCYLLPRLDTSLNDSSMINWVVDPMFEAAFQLDPNGFDFGKDKSLKFLQLWIYRRPKFSWINFRSIQMGDGCDSEADGYDDGLFCCTVFHLQNYCGKQEGRVETVDLVVLNNCR